MAATQQRRRTTEIAQARLLSLYIATGLGFLLLPGTFLGVWNLLQVSSRHDVALVSPLWLQAHGHAQVFGWVATFILGIGFYAIPIVSGARAPLTAARACWCVWTAGVTMRWAVNIYGWQWRWLLPAAALLEAGAFVIFFGAVFAQRHHLARAREPWLLVARAGAIGLALTLLLNAVLSAYVAWLGVSPEFPHALNERLLTLGTWGFLAPFVWGFSMKWLPVLLGLRAPASPGVIIAVAANALGVVLALAGLRFASALLFAAAAMIVTVSLHVLEPAMQSAKIRGVHPSFPFFIRFAYVWLVISAWLGAAAASWDTSGGIWGASRHAFTVGFISVMVFSIGQRVLPAFAAMGPLWSPRVMFAGLLFLTVGCGLRVISEIASYQYGAAWGWTILPVSALLEMTAVTLFTFNMAATFAAAPEPLPAPSPA